MHLIAVEKFRRLRTFWNILIADRRISLSCGRPYSIRDLDVDVQRPSDVFEQVSNDIPYTEQILNLTQNTEPLLKFACRSCFGQN